MTGRHDCYGTTKLKGQLLRGGVTDAGHIEGKGQAKNMIPWDRLEEFFSLNLENTIER